ncbi:MAG: cytochrome P450 [Microthrixaceae bacterium]
MTGTQYKAPQHLELFSGETFWSQGSATREETFQELRETAPICFMEEPIIPDFPQGPGFWSLTRHADVMEVSRHPEIFCSGLGTNIPDLPIEIAEFMGSMINMDSPRHTRLRMIVNRAFTPKRVALIDRDVRVKARQIVASISELGECDAVEQLAAQLPLQVICEMMGIPNEHWHRVFELTNVILGAGDPEFTPTMEALMSAVMELAMLAQSVGEDRLANPTDDLVSAMMHAQVDGEHLLPMEMASFFILLSAAGNETTRNAISHGLYQLTEHEDQRQIWQTGGNEVTPTAIEEIVRWSTPVVHFRRTATCDTQIAGVKILQGEKVALWYESANRDALAFENPQKFDLLRSPNEHVGFGAGGPHFCLGANLARREIGVIFEELFRWLPDIRITSEPEYLQSAFIHGIKRMRCEFTPAQVGQLEEEQ